MEITKLTLTLLLMLITIMTAGCEEKKGPVSRYGDSLISAHDGGKRVAEQATLKGLKDAIRVYHISNGRYPQSFEEVQGLMGSSVDSGIFHYDPENGEIRLER